MDIKCVVVVKKRKMGMSGSKEEENGEFAAYNRIGRGRSKPK